MAACQLKIELDNPDSPRTGGEPVTGTVIVNTTESVKCSGLEATSYWCTHGRGNVEQGDIDQAVLFQGNWEPQREYRYPFSLKTATWPPTYYGTYLNVSQLVRARARVPWASDPKTDAEFIVTAKTSPDDLKPTATEIKKSRNWLGWIFGWTIGLVLLIVIGVAFGAVLLVLLPLLGIGGACYWFFRVFLPKQITGSIDCKLEPKKIAPGETAAGQLRFTPRRNVSIHGIHWKVTCVEKCVSGSGSNRTTHQHEIFNHTQKLSDAATLQVGQPQSFEFSFQAPNQSPPSLKFSNNEVIWSGELRIDIPKWPDYVRTFPLTVTPSATFSGHVRNLESGGTGGSGLTNPTAQDEEWFSEVVDQILQSYADRARMQTVLDAVRDHVFVVRISDLQREQPSKSVATREPGEWFHANWPEDDVKIAIFWPSRVAPLGTGMLSWCGSVKIIGYDDELEGPVLEVV